MFLVCGSGRSGTSAVARLLHESGITMGHDLIEADESNAEGYFEERAVVDANDAVLNDVGLREWFSTATRAQILEAAHARGEALRAIAGAATLGWKDPRFCWTLEVWLELLPDAPRIIVCLRNPAEVTASTLRYFGLAGEEAERAVAHSWHAGYERLLEIITEYGLDATCIEYSRLHGDKRSTTAALARFVGRKLDASAVRADLRHHESAVPAEAAEMYERVKSLGGARLKATRYGGAHSTSTRARP